MGEPNSLAKYFSNSSDLNTKTKDSTGTSFFDIIGSSSDSKNCEPIIDSENDWIYDYWVPPSGNSPKSSSVFLNPSFSINERLLDPIKQLVFKYFGLQEASKRVFPTIDTVTADIEGLEKLITSGCFRSVIDLTQTILKNISQSNHNIQFKYAIGIWFIRVSMLLKLKLYAEADSELKQFENFDKEEFYFDNEKNKSIVPFGFRIIAAEIGLYNKRISDSINQLYLLLEKVNKILKEINELPSKCLKDIILSKIYELLTSIEAIEIWSIRKINVQMAIANCLLNAQEYKKAIDILQEILDSKFSDKQAIYSCLGKIFVQIGDVVTAGELFLKAKAITASEDTSTKLRNLLNDGILRIENGLYEEAYVSFSEAHSINKNLSLVVNNMALCLFYTGRLRDAIKLLEDVIFNKKDKQLSHESVFNLCTLYELESSKAQQKKFNLLLWMNVNVGDGFYESSLKL